MTSEDSERGTFTYSNPTVVHWGPRCLTERLDGELRRLGARRAFVVTTRSVARDPVLIESLEVQLGDRLVGCFAGIGQHAPALSVAEAAVAAREARPDVLLSFGGGSPIDAAKAIAFALATDLDLADPSAPARAAEISTIGRPVLPHLAVPTTLSAAEMSGSAGFSAVETREKVGLRAPELLPAAVFYDAELSLQTPAELWLSTGIRAVDHAVEGILSRGEHPFQDTMALEALRRLQSSLLATR
ncbi:MAG: iron-containing alcohol dehydrogenase, partial [Chloroflexi bacterium]|nr:iron-containing alcohol dehydrogenase [Chloroflexota bacterium]